MSNENGDHHENIIHLPSPSAAPIVLAAGMTFLLAGILSPLLLLSGVILTAAGLGLWVFGDN